MAKERKKAIAPLRSENYPEWYQQVIRAANLAETSPVRGCMVINPWGYALWENIQRVLDGMIKDSGHKNAYFPLFIPLSFMEKEAEHVEGFAKECAVVTHHRLEADGSGSLKPAGELEEPLVVRPTSETIIGEMFSKWIQSYRDLPLLINQWANIVRWEMRTRLFLRTTEFLWQEGHTAHATKQEALDETFLILDLYATFAEEYMAMPVIKGEKTEGERFPGAVSTYCIEAMMQDGKALQSGTSHFLGQNFSRAADITYLSDEGAQEFTWTTSWGVSTRLIGGLIMTHGDDDGIIVPPRLAPSHVVILPIAHKEESRADVLQYCENLAKELHGVTYDGRLLSVELDKRDIRGGEKMWSWIKKGIPLWVEVGPRDIAEDSVFLGRRDRVDDKRISMKRADFLAKVPAILEDIQQGLFDRACSFRETHSRNIDSKEEFYEFFSGNNNIASGFAWAHWAGGPEEEEQIKTDLNVTVRCIPLEPSEEGTCIFTGKPSAARVVFAKSY
jgi:prolyl-tRNA synthetase